MKTLVCFRKLESDVVAEFAVRVKSQSKQYNGSVPMECTATDVLYKYQFFTLAPIIQHLIIYTPTTKKLIYQVCLHVQILPYGSYYRRDVSIF